jgi:alpha,alpha-trehalase
MTIKNIFSSGELFQRVQLENIFRDGKTFVDCTPRNDLHVILRDYEMQKLQRGFDLAAFVKSNFILPESQEPKYFSVEGRPIRQHIELLWEI